MNVPRQSKLETRIGLYCSLLMVVVVLPLCAWTFGTKLYELVVWARTDVSGVFTVTPLVNYLFAALGFLCLFGWAAANGMFRDIERPKYTMLENEERLDALLGQNKPSTGKS